MELEELKSRWKSSNMKLQNKEENNHLVIITQKSYLKRNKTAIEGILCIMVSVFLIVMLIIQKIDLMDMESFIIYMCWFIISIYTLVRGIYTIFFFINMSALDMESSKFLRNNLRNQLYFVYEKLTWLWFLIPLIIVAFPFFITKFIIIPEGTVLIYSLTISMLYLITLFVFSKTLWRKRQKIKEEIEKIELSK